MQGWGHPLAPLAPLAGCAARPACSRLTSARPCAAAAAALQDEPTSGLDARAAGIVMDAVRSTVDTGRVVVCTM